MTSQDQEAPEYSDLELANVAQSEADLIGVQHSSYGCVGCELCTRRTMLELVASRLNPEDVPYDLVYGPGHPQCVKAGKHVCQEPSGQECVEKGCAKPAGTWWGPNWCPTHDKLRIDRISSQFEGIQRQMGVIE